jgi:hypothetical protein
MKTTIPPMTTLVRNLPSLEDQLLLDSQPSLILRHLLVGFAGIVPQALE